METQNVRPDGLGRYAVELGAANAHGLPTELFASGEARWLAVQPEAQPEQARVLLLSVPYALKAADAETVGGLPPSAFMLAQPRTTADGVPAASGIEGNAVPPAGAVTGTGTADFLPLWTSTSNIGNSAIFQSGSGTTAKVGVNTTTPATPLDVKGAVTVRGNLALGATGVATSTAGKISQPTTFTASAFNSTTSTAVNQNFRWQAEPAGNNTSTASGSLNLLYAKGAAAPAETGFKFGSNGLITFATGQKFPGTGPGTITGVAAGSGLSGGGNSGSVTLSLNTTQIPELSTNNTFTGTEQFKGNTGVGVPPSSTGYTPLTVGTPNSFGTWLAIANTSSGGHTWNIISAGAGNAEGAGNLGITDLTGSSTIWLEGNSRTSSLTATGAVVGATVTATGSAGGSIVEADINGANNTTPTPGLRFGGATSGETIASNRLIGLNRFGLDFYTDFAARMSITQVGLIGIGTKIPRNQLDVVSQSTQYVGINATGATAANGSNQGGGNGIQAFGGDADPSATGIGAGNGFVGWGGGGGFGGVGGFFTAGSGNGETQSAIWTEPGPGSDPTNSGAGFFDGNILVAGGVSSADISRIIDDPVDPANKYLYHSSVESSDMKNIYDGVVTLDGGGEATVSMPEWFSALNRDFRYQLTCIGGFAPIYISEELTSNQFKIGGGRPGMKVSWQVTGIRQDAWSNAHRIPPEVEKSATERGFYMAPELFGAPQEKSVAFARNPEMVRQVRARQKALANKTAEHAGRVDRQF